MLGTNPKEVSSATYFLSGEAERLETDLVWRFAQD
jgi:hypothetical protein